jgi:conjugative transposon TraM protein
MENIPSAKFLRKRKMMLVLPALVFPFITMAFWAMGGGKAKDKQDNAAAKTGLNLQLPDAKLKDDRNEDKLTFYEQADADSLKRLESLSNDPGYRDSLLISKKAGMLAPGSLYQTTNGLNNSPYKKTASDNEQKIYQKIEELNRQINLSPTAQSPDGAAPVTKQDNQQLSGEVDRLQNMMQGLQHKDGNDPEMQELNGTLEKILDIQHPGRVKEKLSAQVKEQSKKDKESVFVVSKSPVVKNVSMLGNQTDTAYSNIGFYSLENGRDTEDKNTIEAVVDDNQSLVSGAYIKLRLQEAVYINGAMIPKGNSVYGMASINNERLSVQITHIRSGQAIYPVKLEVYDLDGIPGLHIPGVITGDALKQSADNGLQLMELGSMDPSFKMQATAAGINGAKNLLTKKIKQVKVFVKGGYKVLLKNINN